MLPILFLEVFLGEPGVKFDQVCIQDTRSSFPFVLSKFAGLGNRALGFICLNEPSFSSSQLGKSGSPYNAIIERRTIDH